MRILACVDIRDASAQSVIKAATNIAGKTEGTVDLMYVTLAPSLPGWLTDPVSVHSFVTQWEKEKEADKKSLNKAILAIPTTLRGQTIVAEGRPVDAIVDQAKGYDLVILTLRRHSTIEKLLVGTIALQLARNLTVPALFLRPDTPNPASPKSLAVALDLQMPQYEQIAEAAKQWAINLNAKMDAVYIDETESTLYSFDDSEVRERFHQQWTRAREQSIHKLEKILADLPYDLRGHARLEDGDTSTRMKEMAAEYDLMFVATHGRRGMSRLMMGSVAEGLLKQAKCSILLFRAKE